MRNFKCWHGNLYKNHASDWWMDSCDQQAMSLFMQTANDIIVHANSKRKEAIVEIYDIACWTNIKAFQGLPLPYVTMHLSHYSLFSNPWLSLPLTSRTISINPLIANRSVILQFMMDGACDSACGFRETVRVRVIRPNARLRKWPTARVVEWALKWIINQMKAV